MVASLPRVSPAPSGDVAGGCNPRVYLAGKIGPDDWRNQIVNDRMLADASADRYEDPATWPVLWGAIMGGLYNYTGPYFISCDHGCYHGPTRHGVGAIGLRHEFDDYPGCSGDRFQAGRGGNRARVLRLCRDAIARSDIVFAWIEDETAYGTIAEIGYAHALGKRIWIAGPERFPELWFVYEMAEHTGLGSPDPATAFKAFALGEGVGLAPVDSPCPPSSPSAATSRRGGWPRE